MRRAVRAMAATSATVAMLLGGAARAQVVERNLPPAPQSTPQAVAPAAPPAAEADATPIGPPLRAILLLDGPAAVRGAGMAGVADGVAVAPGLRLSGPRAAAVLHATLGQRLSRKLIADIAAAITRAYRAAGYPFVAVSTPEQEVSAGVLQVRVIEFRAGRIGVSGARATPPGYVTGRLRLKSGAAIDAIALAQDLDWLNRNPFRQVSPVFSPGAALGLSDVELTVAEVRPWRVYGGAATSGSAATGAARFFAGAQAAGLPGLPDAQLSFQVTASANAIDTRHPDYLSEATRLTVPFAPRADIELTYDHVATSQRVEAFVSRQRIDEASIGYRTALARVATATGAALLADATLGIEARRANRRLLFGDVEVTRATVDVFQLDAGATARLDGPRSRSTASLTLHVSPGGIDRNDRDDAYAAFTGRPRAAAAYAYLNGTASRTMRLSHGFALSSDILFQLAAKPLPATEQVALGGPGAVRGYTLDDGGFDGVLIARNELHAPGLRVARAAMLQPRLFLDVGRGTLHGGRPATAVSAGIGGGMSFGTHLQLNADAGCALRTAARTRAGDCRVEARLVLGV